MQTYDLIVVGAGTAGCLLANRLSSDLSLRVLLIEAGGRDDYHWIRIPVGYLFCIGNPRTDWLLQTEPEAGLHGRTLRYPRGKVWGGCSSINGMIYMRGQAADYALWDAEVPGWRWEDVLPYFLKHEDSWRRDGGAGDPLHGGGGEWRVEKQRLSWEILDAFRQAAAQAGIPPTDDFNRGDNFGCGYFEVNQRRGERWNTARGFLRPVLGRPNLTVLSGVTVTDVVLEGAPGERQRACGVTVRRADGRVETIRAAREVVLAAGAVGSPALLQRSGIGPEAVLAAAGVAVRHRLDGVGEHLQDHLQLRTVFRVQGVKTLNEQANRWLGKAAMGLEYLLFKTGPMTMAPSQLGAFARSRPEVAHADVEYHVQPLSLGAFGEPLHDFPAFTASVCQLRPTSRGTVRIRSADPMQPPAIQPNYLSTDEDRRVAADAIRLTRRIVASPALGRYRPEEWKPGAALQTDEALARAAGEIGTTIFHPVGTCRMGRSADDGSVVDGRLRVFGVDGLRVVDASVMPRITSGNTNSPTLMIAERAAEWILADAHAAAGASAA